MSKPKVEEVTWYQFTVTKGMAYAIYRMIGRTSVNERIEVYGISKEDSDKVSALYRKLGGLVDE